MPLSANYSTERIQKAGLARHLRLGPTAHLCFCVCQRSSMHNVLPDPSLVATLRRHRPCTLFLHQVKGLLDKGGVLMAKTGGYLANVRAHVKHVNLGTAASPDSACMLCLVTRRMEHAVESTAPHSGQAYFPANVQGHSHICKPERCLKSRPHPRWLPPQTQTAVLVATPGALAEVLTPPQPQPVLDAARFLVIDEVDACLAVRSLTSIEYLSYKSSLNTIVT